jgi:hypothetical protein
MPTNGNPIKTTTIPPKKASEALTLCFWKKNLNVRSSPITQASPQMNRMFPMASNPLSNIKSTPKNKNAIPNPAKPTPISGKENFRLAEALYTQISRSK